MSFKDEEISFANEITEIHENILTPFFFTKYLNLKKSYDPY